MLNDILLKIAADLLVPIIALAVTTIGIPWGLKMLKKAGLELSDAEEKRIRETIETLVRMAENTIQGQGKGKEKFELVLKEATKELLGAGIDVAKYNLQARIEAIHHKVIADRGADTPS